MDFLSKPKFWKYMALASAGIYVFQVARQNGGTLKGNPEGIKLNKDKFTSILSGLAVLHPNVQEPIKNALGSFINKLAGD
ncbi:MAG: hypothetical protein IT410_01240 [Candidatus Doudnabacteria bacterium]|nr:hypothetical protein [Candidatus Doudnabacteria bacterium]